MRHCFAMQVTKVNGCVTYLSVRLLYMEVFGDVSKNAGICPRLLFMAFGNAEVLLCKSFSLEGLHLILCVKSNRTCCNGFEPRNVCGIEWPAPSAAMRRRTEIVQWACGNYCACDELAWWSAAFGRHLKTLQVSTSKRMSMKLQQLIRSCWGRAFGTF